ncbi:hypothetical protein QTO34_005575 [Cnephaeus nilssonii]|uniref:Uncharacterized protein n=1 Tax=Cnephaeus nilssonii TaxID=3371016 RepID=A0AA40HNS9_CNENI|nr:hypothetical protein QTO34_005575 [Eptesicus nilssonii]
MHPGSAQPASNIKGKMGKSRAGEYNGECPGRPRSVSCSNSVWTEQTQGPLLQPQATVLPPPSEPPPGPANTPGFFYLNSSWRLRPTTWPTHIWGPPHLPLSGRLFHLDDVSEGVGRFFLRRAEASQGEWAKLRTVTAALALERNLTQTLGSCGPRFSARRPRLCDFLQNHFRAGLGEYPLRKAHPQAGLGALGAQRPLRGPSASPAHSHSVEGHFGWGTGTGMAGAELWVCAPQQLQFPVSAMHPRNPSLLRQAHCQGRSREETGGKEERLSRETPEIRNTLQKSKTGKICKKLAASSVSCRLSILRESFAV